MNLKEVAIIRPGRDSRPWVAALQPLARERKFTVYPETGWEQAGVAITFQHPSGIFQQMPNLQLIYSAGAGVDHLFNDPQLPPSVPIVRLVCPQLTLLMQQFVVHQCIDIFRGFNEVRQQQSQRRWHQPQVELPHTYVVAVLGLGAIGGPVARALGQQGFKVRGWSRTSKPVEGVDCYTGASELEACLRGAQIAVCLLPLTPLTQGILNRRSFDYLAAGGHIINVGRAAHLVEADLVEALNVGKLGGARLDVFQEEPLPATHLFWGHPKIQVTPHMSSLTHPASVAPQIIENLRRIDAGLKPLNQIDRQRGY